MDEPRFVEVYWARATSVDLLRHVCGLLEEAGIEPRLVKEEDHLGDWIAGPGSGAAFRIWVREGDESRARQVIAQWKGRRELEAPAAAWQCQQCGEEVEGNFDICWNCQSSRGSTGPEHAASGGASGSDGEEPTLAIPFEGPSAEPAADFAAFEAFGLRRVLDAEEAARFPVCSLFFAIEILHLLSERPI